MPCASPQSFVKPLRDFGTATVDVKTIEDGMTLRGWQVFSERLLSGDVLVSFNKPDCQYRASIDLVLKESGPVLRVTVQKALYNWTCEETTDQNEVIYGILMDVDTFMSTIRRD